MIPEQILGRAVVALAVIFALSLLLLLGHGAWLVLARKHSGRHLARGRAALAGLIASGTIAEEDRQTLRGLPAYVRSRLFLETVRNFGGEVHDRVAQMAEEIGMVDAAERAARSPFWWRRLRAVRLLTALGASAEQVRALLRDPHPAVRAQVAEAAAAHPTPAVLAALLEMLSASDTLYRFTVQDALLRAGRAAVDPMAEFLARHRGPVVLPALEVAAILAHPSLTRPALQLSADAAPQVRARAADVLGAVGGEEAIARLCELLQDEVAGVRAAAAQALGRLRHWPASAALAPLLRDRAWEVRRAAGLALRSLGGPGVLFLRRYQADDDRFAADMATQILELPGAPEEVGA